MFRSMVVSSEKSTPGVHVLEHEDIVNAAKAQE